MTVEPKFITRDIAVGTPSTGLWCETCSLPSRYEAKVYALGADGLIHVATVNRCDGHQP